MVKKVVDLIDADDALSLKLVCKTMKSHLPIDLKTMLCDLFMATEPWNLPSREPRPYEPIPAFLEAHRRAERFLSVNGPLPSLFCSSCMKLQPRSAFEDSHIQNHDLWLSASQESSKDDGKGAARCCITCYIKIGYITDDGDRIMTVNGEEKFGCFDCQMACALDQRVRFKAIPADTPCDDDREDEEQWFHSLCRHCAKARDWQLHPEEGCDSPHDIVLVFGHSDYDPNDPKGYPWRRVMILSEDEDAESDVWRRVVTRSYRKGWRT